MEPIALSAECLARAETPAEVPLASPSPLGATHAAADASVGGWLGKSFWAIADQGLFSVSNFAMTVLLARWLPRAEQYGAFAMAMSLMYLLGTIHNSLLIEPMLVFGPRRERGGLPQYFTALLLGHGLVTLPGALLLTAAGVVCLAFGDRLGGPGMARALISAGLASPVVLFLWLMRRTCYVRLDPFRAAVAGLGYLVLMLVGLSALYLRSLLSVPTAMGVMAAASLASGLWMARREGVGADWPSREVRAAALHDHWEYGRWSLGSGLVAYVPQQIFFLLIPVFADLAQSGSLRAMMNLVTPLVQANSAFCVLLLPRLVRNLGTAQFRRTIRSAALLLSAAAVVYWLALGWLNRPIMQFFYVGKFPNETALLWIIGLQPLFTGLGGVHTASLEARKRPDLAFWAGLWSALFCVTVGLWLSQRFGLTGVAITIAISLSTRWLMCWWFDHRLPPETRAAVRPPQPELVVSRHEPAPA